MNSSHGLPLNLHLLLSQKFLELHEFALMAMNEWPENMLLGGIPEPHQEILERGGFFFPGEGLKALSEETKNFIEQLKIATSNGEIISHSIISGPFRDVYKEETIIFIPVIDAITWFLLNGHFFPKEIQEKIDIRQKESDSFSESSIREIKNKFFFQMILSDNPSLGTTKLLHHPWIKDFASPMCEREMRRHWSSLKENGIEEPLKEVVSSNSNEKSEYCFKSLGTILDMAVRIKIKIEWDKISKMSESEFYEYLRHDRVVSMYMQGATRGVLLFFIIICRKRLVQNCYSHHKLQTLPSEEREKMTIGELKEKHEEFLFERFTPEEREKIKSNMPFLNRKAETRQ